MKQQRLILFMLFSSIATVLFVTAHDTPQAEHHIPHNCRFWGIVYAEKDQIVKNTIQSHLDSLQSLGTTHDDGWGIAYYIDMINDIPLPMVERGEPEAHIDLRFNRASDHVIAYANKGAIAHIRNASSGPQSGIPDPHPFSRYAVNRELHIFFAHNGTMDTGILFNLIYSTNPAYLDLNPPDYAPEYLDSDLYALFLLEIIDMNAGRAIEDCIRIAVTAIDSAFQNNTAQCNFVMFDGTSLYAVNFSRAPLDALTLYLYAPLWRSHFWAVASEPLDAYQQSWVAVPNSTLVVLKPYTPPRFYNVLLDKNRALEINGFNIIYPNPFTEEVTISFSISHLVAINRTYHIRIFNNAGQLVRTLYTDPNDRGNPNVVVWNGYDEEGNRLPAGAYYCFLASEDTSYTKKIVFLR